MPINRVHSMTYETEQNGRDTDHVAVCSCGWQSLPMANPFDVLQETCAVLEAEVEGARRRSRRTRRKELAGAEA